MVATTSKNDSLALRQIEGVAHAALDTGDGLAATATATVRGSGYHVSLAFDPAFASEQERWIAQVEGEVFIARCTGLMSVAVTVESA